MARVVLPSTLLARIDGSGPLQVDGPTAGEVIRGLESREPRLKGWVLDEQGRLREHVSLFVNDRQAGLDRAVTAEDELYVVQAISGGRPEGDRGAADRIELLVSTRKGLFVVRGSRGGPAEVVHREFAGQTVEYACRDARTGTCYASVTHGQFGPHLYVSDDPTAGWEEADGPAFPEGTEASVERIWIVQPGEAEGELWAGVAPAALFRSGDGGRTWSLNRPLWERPERAEWSGGMGGLCLHSICPWPGDPARLSVGISAAGVWTTEDGGESWRRTVQGLVPRYIPEEARAETHSYCIHKLLRAPLEPSTLYLQFHGGVYRSDDAGESWADVGSEGGLPADFGFPLALDPHDPDAAYVIPMVADVDRVTPEGRLRVFETRDRGGSWQGLDNGLPQRDAYLTVLRQAFCDDGRSPVGLYFGTESGSLFASTDAGASWAALFDHLPPIVAVSASA